MQNGFVKILLRDAVAGLAPKEVLGAKRKRDFNASIEPLVDRKDGGTIERLPAPGPIFDVVKREVMEIFLTNYGSLYKSEFLLRFRARSGTSEFYDPVIREFARSANLLHVEPSGDEHQTVSVTYDIVLNKEADPEELSRRISALDGLGEMTLTASKSDVDY